MNTVTTGVDTPAAADAATVENSESAPETQQDAANGEASTDSDTSGENSGDDAADKPKRKHWAHDRIDELTRKYREAERQAEMWKARASQTVDIDSLDYEDQIAARVSTQYRKEQADMAADAARQTGAELFSLREAEAKERYADYEAVARNPNVAITQDMAEIIYDSPTGPELAYHLGKNPQEALRIAQMTPARQARELGLLEARLSAPKDPPKHPPRPVAPVGSQAAGGASDPSKMSMAEYVAARQAGRI